MLSSLHLRKYWFPLDLFELISVSALYQAPAEAEVRIQVLFGLHVPPEIKILTGRPVGDRHGLGLEDQHGLCPFSLRLPNYWSALTPLLLYDRPSVRLRMKKGGFLLTELAVAVKRKHLHVFMLIKVTVLLIWSQFNSLLLPLQSYVTCSFKCFN